MLQNPHSIQFLSFSQCYLFLLLALSFFSHTPSPPSLFKLANKVFGSPKFLFIPVLHIRSLSPKPSGRYLPRVCFICLLVVTYFIFCAQLQSSLKHCDFWAIFLSFFNTIIIKQRQSLLYCNQFFDFFSSQSF